MNIARFRRHGCRAVALLLLIALLAACATGPSTAPPADAERPATAARALAAEGRYAEAAARFEVLAATAANPAQAAGYRLSAAEAWLRAGRTARADAALRALPDTLSGPSAERRRLLLGALALHREDPEQALQWLQPPAPDTTNLRRRYHALRAQAYAMGGFPEKEARERVALDTLLLDPEARLANQRAVLQALAHLPEATLAGLADAELPDALTPWAQLSRIVQARNLRSDEFVRRLAEWQARYPFHPAAGNLAARLVEQHRAGRTYPTTVAVILPFNGDLGAAGQAVRDGLLAAYYRRGDGTEAPRITLYDSSGADVAALYRQALAEGAEAVVGPLEKGNVARLAEGVRQTDSRDVPVLALNAAETLDNPPEAFYQFGLLPEDEARQAAERAWREGHRRAVALVPEGDWGLRLQQAFGERWEALGGTLLESNAYPPEATDFSGPITDLLNLDQSRARYSELRRILRRPLHFEPRRRQDVDFLFLAAQAPQARLIRPQLAYHYAQDLPVYATSHVYTGVPAPQQDHDLDGIRFVDTPWTLQAAEGEGPGAELAELWPDRAPALGRLFALGWDAYRILPLLPQLREASDRTVPGLTGRLSVDAEGRVHRELPWATFAGGRVREVAPPPPAEPAADAAAEPVS